MALNAKILNARCALPKRHRSLAIKARSKLYAIMQETDSKATYDVVFGFVCKPEEIALTREESPFVTSTLNDSLREYLGEPGSGGSSNWDLFTQGNGDVGAIEGYFPTLSFGELAMIRDAHYASYDCNVEQMDDSELLELCDAYDGVDSDEAKGYVAELREVAKAFQSDDLGAGCSLVENFVSDIKSELMDDMFTDAMIWVHINELMECMFYGGGEMQILVYSSKEVYEYRTYRDRLPAEKREEADGYVNLFKDPFATSDACSEDDESIGYGGTGALDLDSEYNDESRTFSVFVPCYSYGAIEEELSPLFEFALCYVAQELPKLREQYGSVPEGLDIPSGTGADKKAA